MPETLLPLRTVFVSTTLAMLLAACASEAPAPVEARTSAKPVPSAAELPVARPGYYIVKRGDTLYSIAHQFERDYRELATWNGLDDPNVIKSGQELRVVPPGAVTEAAASSPAGGEGLTVVAVPTRPVIESSSLQDGSGAASSVTSTAVDTAVVAAVTAPPGQKTEPKGGRIAYSEQAWKDLQVRDKQLAAGGAQSSSAARSAEARGSESRSAGGSDNVDWIWPGPGKVLATFNDSSNKGVDIAGNIGDPVVASGSGRIVYVGSGLRGYGNLVIIKHNNNFLSAYAHNSEILVKEGQAVQKGQKIATLGNSDAQRPMLHFEIRLQGKPVDPMKYLPPR